MEKITCFSRPAYALKQQGLLLVLVGLMLTFSQVVSAQFTCDAGVQSFTIIIDEEDECIDILDINPDGQCCGASGGCIELNVTIPEGVCLALLRDDEVAVGDFFIDNCLNPQSEGSNLTPATPTSTTIDIVYCTTDDGVFNFQLCAKQCCVLDVTCPEADAGTIQCIESIPPPVGSIAEFLTLPGASIDDFCEPLTIENTLMTTTNSGCPNDTIFAAYVYKISDPYDSVFCTRTYKIVDNIAPIYTLPADTIISCESSTLPSSTGDITDASDNCNGGTPLIEFTDMTTPGSCLYNYIIERTWTVRDDCGNSSEGVQTITVVDATPPTYVLPSDTIVECQEDTSVAALGGPTMLMDNCSSVVTMSHRDEFVTSPCPMAYTVWRIWQFEDECNNIAIDTQTIEVVDTVPPTFVIPADMSLDCSDDTSTASTGVPMSLDDNCHMVSVSYRDLVIPTGFCAASYDFFRIWTIVDECGNIRVDTQRFMVRDNMSPDITAPGDTTVSCEANLSMVNLGRLVDTSDDCSLMTVSVTDDTLTVDCRGTFTMRRIWLVTDECGNTNSDDQVITVIDTTAPVAIFPSDVLIPCLGDTSPVATGMASGIDNCGGDVIITYNDVVTPTSCLAEYTVEREWIVMDSCGNEVRDTQIIEVDCVESIGLAKTVFDIDPPSSGIRGNFNATFELSFQNDGNTKLMDIQIEDDIRDQFARNFVEITPGGEPKIIYSNADTTPVLNPDFDGDIDNEIFDGISGCVQPGQKVTIRFTAEIDPQIPGTPKRRLNSAIVRAMGPCGLPVDDLSDTGIDPLGSNPGELGNTGGSDDPTVLPLECVGPGAPPMACNKHTNISLDENCSLDIPASVILEGEDYICDMFYELMITDHHGRLVPSPIPGDLKGETLYVKVIDAIFGNSCWGTILVEDKFRPTIECVNDTIYCNALDSVPPPIHYDNCDPNPILRLVRVTKEDLVCDTFYTKRVIKTWQAEDNCGNKSFLCEQVIMLRRVFLDSIDYPKDFTLDNNCALKCNGVYPLDSLGHPHPSFTGAPSIDGYPLYPYHLHCNISTDYTDRILKHGPCVKKIMRLWRVVEWHCTNSAIREVPQLIHIIDDEPPVITCPTVDYVTTDGGYDCEATIDLPPAFVYDSCSFDSVRVDIIYPGGILKNQNGGRIKLPYGVHQVRYVAYDQCYNSSECIIDIEVVDHTPPVTICDGFTTIGLNEFGEAHMYAATLDDGTYDDCYLDSFAVRRMDMGANCNNPDTLFKPYIRFCCDDVDSTNVMVVFRAWDKAGNYNDCMVEVEVQDKVPPVVYCPPNITISCDYHFDMDSLAQTFGTIVQNKADRQPIVINDPNLRVDGPLFDGHVLENCEVEIEEMVVDSLSQCRTGTIWRGFTIRDKQGLESQCFQRITIIDFDPFDSLDIKWPLNYTTSTCGTDFHPDSLPTIYGRPEIDDDVCSLVGMEWDDHVFSFVQDSLVCFKVLRKWKIIDWCDFRMEGNTQVYKKYTYEQIIKVNNVIPPTISGDCDDITVCTYDPDCEDGQVVLTKQAADDCTPNADLRWSFHIDLNRDGIIDTTASGVGNTANATGFYPIGQHYITWAFEDQCGNRTVCRQSFEVVNCKPPSAYCKNGLVVDLMPVDTNNDGSIDGGVIDIWANDLDDNSSHPCGNEIVLSFSPDTSDKFRRYTCDSLGMRQVTIYVTDKKSGEISSCVTFVEVQDNQGACPMTSGMIAGRIWTEDDLFIEQVDMSIDGTFSGSEMVDGAYQFDRLPLNGNYTVSPFKDDYHLNGISTKDIILLQRHLLGLKTLVGPYKRIAADVNRDDDISVRDIVELRRLLLGHHTRLPDNTSWRFIHKEYVFPDPLDPWLEQFEEEVDVFDMNGAVYTVDFVGAKIGDLDASVDPAGLNANQTRSEGNFDLAVNCNGSIMQFVAMEDEFISGLQMTMKMNGDMTQLMRKEDGLISLSEEHIGLNEIDQGLMRLSWNQNDAIEVKKGDILFTFEWDADVASSELQLINYPIQSELYTEQLEVKSLVLNQMDDSSEGIVVYQNQPNPFSRTTEIGIESSEMLDAGFKVYDASGRIFVQKDIQLQEGINVIEVSHDNLNGTGVYYYQVQTELGITTKKMILIE